MTKLFQIKENCVFFVNVYKLQTVAKEQIEECRISAE